MQISPDGTHIVAVAEVEKTAAVFLIDTATLGAEMIVKQGAGFDMPLYATWVGNDLLAVQYFFGTNVIDKKGVKLRSIGSHLIRTVNPDGKNERVVAAHDARGEYLYRIDVRTGKSILMNIEEPPGKPVRWVFDDEGVSRVVTTMNTKFWSDDTSVTHWYRESLDDKWRSLATFQVTEDMWVPIYLTRDGKSLVVTSLIGRDTIAYFNYSVKEGKIGAMLAGHPREDIRAERDDDNDAYQRVITYGMKPMPYWFDEKWARVQNSVDAVLPGRVNVLSGDPKGRVLIFSYADIDPGQWYLLDAQKMTMRHIGPDKDGVDPAKMRPMEVIEYASFDGLKIPAYLTRPASLSAPGPAVLLIHGGPMVRDGWGWDAEVQMLASRGYAVFQPQFRGSSGFGKQFMQAGYGQWGLAMQDDVTAGVKWLIDQKIADPKRICIYGASYGGYAAQWALAKTPDLFQCAISYAGVSDLNYLFKDRSDVNDSPVGRLFRRHTIGDPKMHKQLFNEVSPLQNVERFKAPILVGHGTLDARVPVDHSEKLVRELKRHRKTHEWIELEGEGHGIAKPENREKYYQAVFDFLDRYIGAKAGAAKAADVVAR
jgi:dienelactone hydrolase